MVLINVIKLLVLAFALQENGARIAIECAQLENTVQIVNLNVNVRTGESVILSPAPVFVVKDG